MKVLIVCSGNTSDGLEFNLKIHQPFIYEQVEAVKRFGVEFEFFFIKGKGFSGYFKNLGLLKKTLADNFDLVHAHYGLAGFLVLIAKADYPLVTTFHGNDINPISIKPGIIPNVNKILSRIVNRYSSYSIFVNKDLATKIKAIPGSYDIIPCQVNLDLFYPIDKISARIQFNFLADRRYILFSSSFDNPVKNYSLARKACDSFDNIELIELKGYSRHEVNLLINACDLALITSFNEGSSQFLKEAMACNCPVVSTKAGDAEMILGKTDGCYITSYEVKDVIDKIKMALEFSSTKNETKGRERITELQFDPEHISRKVYDIYLKVIN